MQVWGQYKGAIVDSTAFLALFLNILKNQQLNLTEPFQ